MNVQFSDRTWPRVSIRYHTILNHEIIQQHQILKHHNTRLHSNHGATSSVYTQSHLKSAAAFTSQFILIQSHQQHHHLLTLKHFYCIVMHNSTKTILGLLIIVAILRLHNSLEMHKLHEFSSPFRIYFTLSCSAAIRYHNKRRLF